MNRCYLNRNLKNQGFALIELMVVLAVFAITLTIAVPSFNTFILNNRLSSAADLLVNGLNYARSTALTTNNKIQICPYSAPNSTVCGTDWSQGWIVATQPATGTSILLKSQNNGRNTPSIVGSKTNVTFNSRGLASDQTNFTLCDKRGGAFASSVEVLTTGYIQSGDSAGVAVWDNGTLTCQ